MKSRILVCVVCIVRSTTFLYAQQDPLFSIGQYQNLAYQNPSVVGSHNAVCATMLGRLQYVGFGGEPTTFLFSVQAPFSFLNTSHGIGLTVMSDQLGQEVTTIYKLQYAYKFENVGPGVLSVGLGLGLISKSLGSNWLASQGVVNDPNIPQNGASAGGLDLDFGLFYKIPKKLSIGISTTHLNANQLGLPNEDISGSGTPSSINYQIDRTFYVSAQYEQPISSDGAWVIQPGFYMQTDLSVSTFSLGSLVEYEEKFFGGIHYRLSDAVSVMLGANFQFNGENAAGGMLKVGYSYDVTTSNIRQYSSGTHEIFMRYCFSISGQSQIEKHHTVRFL